MPVSATQLRHFEFFCEAAAIAADRVGALGLGVLDRQLHVIESDGDEIVKQFFRQADAGGDQIGVEPDLRGMGGQLQQVAPRRRLAAGEMRVQNANLGGLRKDALPLFAWTFRRRARPSPAGWSNRGTTGGIDR